MHHEAIKSFAPTMQVQSTYKLPISQSQLQRLELLGTQFSTMSTTRRTIIKLLSIYFMLSWGVVLHTLSRTGSLDLTNTMTTVNQIYYDDIGMENAKDSERNDLDEPSEDEHTPSKRHNNSTSSELKEKNATLRKDPCRGVSWNEILIHVPGVCSSKANSEHGDNDVNQHSNMDTHGPIKVESQMDTIMKNVALYFPKMKAEVQTNHTNHTVLVIPNAICLETNLHADKNENEINKYDITLTTHMGAGKYQRFLVLIQRWNGPVSIAVKFTNLLEIQLFHAFILQHLKQLQRVSFHYYIEHAPEYANAYPHNVLRNLAMTHISTEYFLVDDVDIFPSPIDTHDKLRSVIASHPDIQQGLSTDTLYVVPMFDFHEMVPEEELTFDHASFPNKKEDAVRMNATGLISQHFILNYPKGHRAVNYEKWFGNDTGTSYDIVHEHKFEPYVIGSRNMERKLPLFYPYFRGYGFDKYSWYDELAWSGIKLRVMRDFYMFHAKHSSSYGDKDEKRKLFGMNRICAQDFMKDVKGKYRLQEDDHIWNEWRKKICGKNETCFKNA